MLGHGVRRLRGAGWPGPRRNKAAGGECSGQGGGHPGHLPLRQLVGRDHLTRD